MTAKEIPPVDPRIARRPPIIPSQALSPGGVLPDTRDRTETRGKLFTRLFAQSGHDLSALMRSVKSGEQIAAAIGFFLASAW